MTAGHLRQEMERIRQRNAKKILVAADVVKTARAANHPLHDRFDWDNSTAGHKYRLWQAQQLIASVRIIRDGPEEKMVPAFVSLLPDRKHDGGGYRAVADVLKSHSLREEMVKTALSELRGVKARFDSLRELAGVWRSVDLVEKRITRKKSRRAA